MVSQSMKDSEKTLEETISIIENIHIKDDAGFDRNDIKKLILFHFTNLQNKIKTLEEEKIQLEVDYEVYRETGGYGI